MPRGAPFYPRLRAARFHCRNLTCAEIERAREGVEFRRVGHYPSRVRSKRRAPPPWLVLVLVAALASVFWMKLGDPLGDRGLANALSFIVLALAGVSAWLWLVLFSAHLPRVRVSIGLGTLAVLAAAATTLRIEGFSGTLIPTFGLRRATPRTFPASHDPPAGAAASAVDIRTTTPADFPGFLGPRRDGTVSGVRLARSWRDHPPELLWRRPVGAGWSGFAVVNGVAVTLEQRGALETVAAYDVRTGDPLWTHEHPGHFEHFLGGDGPRSTPTIDGGRVYALGVLGLLVCLDGTDGHLIWQHDLLADFHVSVELEAKTVAYGRSNSPLVVGDLLIVPAGGNADERQSGLVAYDKESGVLRWRGPPRQISFASPTHTTLLGVDQILTVNEASVSGHDPGDGHLLWEYAWPGTTAANASVSQAVPLAPDHVLLSKGYGGGAALLRLVPRKNGFSAELEWRERRALRTKFTNVVVREGHAYGLSDGILECVDLADGSRAWKQGRYGHGQLLLVDDLLLVIGEEGDLILVEARSDRHVELARISVLEGKTWNNPALYGDILVVRNGTEAAAYRLPLEDR